MEMRRVELIIMLIPTITIMLLISNFSVSAASPSDVITTVSTDKTTYEEGENINVTITLFNPTNASIYLYSGNSPPYNVNIFAENGSAVYMTGPWLNMVEDTTLNPNETMTLSHTIYVNHYPLSPGNYSVVGYAYNIGHSNDTWIMVNGTIDVNPPIDINAPTDSSWIIWIALMSGITMGIIVLFLGSRKRKKKG